VHTGQISLISPASSVDKKSVRGEEETLKNRQTKSNSTSTDENDVLCFCEFGLQIFDVRLYLCVAPREACRARPERALGQDKDMVAWRVTSVVSKIQDS
jgi:hypothetical protein